MRILFAFLAVLCFACTEIQAQNDTDNGGDITSRQAQFPGGKKALFEYFGQQYQKLEKPKVILISSVYPTPQDFAIARIYISADGSISDVKIDSQTSTPYADAIVQKIKSMPKWEPATKNGKPVDTEYLLPLELYPIALGNYIGESAPPTNTDSVECIPVDEFAGMPNIDYYQFVSERLRYPDDALDAGVQGKVIALVTLDTDGKVEDIEISKGLYPSCDNAVKQIINLIPSWTPAISDGEYLKAAIPFTIVFRCCN